MSYPRLFGQLPTQRFATLLTARTAAANYHGVRIARLLAVKLGTRPHAVLRFMPRPLAREAARELCREPPRLAGPCLAGPRSALRFLEPLRTGEAERDGPGEVGPGEVGK